MAKNTQIELKTGEQITLTEKEMLFCQHYISDANRNATQAAIAAKYAQNSARQQGARLLSKANIQKYIHDQTAPVLDALGATKERVLAEWAKLGLSNISDYLEDDWSIKNLSDITKGAQGAIQSVQVEEKVLMQGEGETGAVLDRKIQFKLHDKIKALTKLSEIHEIVKKKEPEPAQGAGVNLFQQVNNYYNSK